MISEIAPVVAAVAFLFILRRLITPIPKVNPRHKAVLVTGCDTGFGHELAQRLHGLGFVVFAGCLVVGGEGARRLRDVDSASADGASGRIHILQMDVTKDEQVTEAVHKVSSLLSEPTGLWAVVNNAGISTFGEVEFCGLNIYQRIANVNLWGTIRVCKAFLPLLRKSQGRVVNVTSILGRQPSPGRSCYVSTKYALEGFTQCLRYEMRHWGVDAIIVEPGNYIAATGIFTPDKIDSIKEEMLSSMPSEVKESYGEDFFKSRVQRMQYFTEVGNKNKEPVVKAMMAAVLDEFPRIRYEPKTMYWHVRTFVMTILPHQIGDYLYHSDSK